MKLLKKAVSLLVAAITMLGPLCGIVEHVFAEGEPLYINIVSYSSGILTVSWSGAIPGTDSVTLSYHAPDIDNRTAILHTRSIPAGENTAQITGIRNNFIYDIRIQMKSGGTVIGEGLLYFCPGIDFTAVPVNETVVDSDPPGFIPPYDPAGGREIGTKPKLGIRWNRPKVYNGAEFDYADASLDYMENEINSVYHEGRELSRIDFRINISTDEGEMSKNAAVIVNGASRKAYVSGYEEVAADVGISGDIMTFDLLGRASSTSEIPVTSGTTLGHREILPGTVYYMTIQAIFQGYSDAVVIHNGSTPLKGLPYTYTFIRFQLSKDDSDNVYVKIYTINQGSLAMPDLYYEVQLNTVDSQYGWETKAQIDSDYFRDESGRFMEFGIVPIIGISPGNNLYYRIMVKSGGSDTIMSQVMPYKMLYDTSRPPLPKGISIKERTLVSGEVGGVGKKSTDVTISWDKPLNWEEIKNNQEAENDVYFCILLSTSQVEITEPPYPPLEDEDGTVYTGFPAKYRLVRYVNARSVNAPDPDADKIIENGNRLEYTLKGLELFKWVNGEGVLDDFPMDLPADYRPEEGYPSYLLNNRVYYLQMYTTKGTPGSSGTFSERSVTISFTTRSTQEKEVPLPANFTLSQPGGNTASIDPDTHKVTNTVKLRFDTVSGIKWADYDSTPGTTTGNSVYYDLYMSTYAGSGYTLIGSTDPALSGTENNVAFEFVSDAQYQYVTATISTFDKGSAVQAFGYGLTPNTAYYFKLRTRLVMPDSIPVERVSDFSPILAVTTVRGEVNPPDDSERVPMAPTDFAIAKDENGNPVLSGSAVKLEWLRQESGVTYTLICTSARIPASAQAAMYENDPVYQNFKTCYSDMIPEAGIGIVLDPDEASGGFEYDNAAKICRMMIDRGLYPNRLYYFAIRAERQLPDGSVKTSVWISIPVTTTLIEAPVALAPVNRPELGFWWTDSETGLGPEDYAIYMKGPEDKDFKPVARTQSTVVKDSATISIGGQLHYVYYGRVYNLEPNAAYSVRVYRGGHDGTMVCEYRNMYTRDAFHEIDVKWRGKAGYEYEVAVKAADAIEYITLEDSDLESCKAVNGGTYPYYIEETSQTAYTDECWFYARIKTIPITLSNGRTEHRALNSNTKYLIKVRAVKRDADNPDNSVKSKYAGPVETRTEFDQDEYDREEDDNNRAAEFLDSIGLLEKGVFWRLAIGNASANKILLKGDKSANAIQHSGSFPFIIDISSYSLDVDTDEVYIPAGVVQTLNSYNKSVVFRTLGAEFTFRPRTLDTENMLEVAEIKENSKVKDIFFKLTIERSDSYKPPIPQNQNMESISPVVEFNVQALGSSMTDAALRGLIHDKLYNKDTGLVQQRLNILADKSGSVELEIDEMVNDIESELSNYLRDVVEGGKGIKGMILTTEDIGTFGTPLAIKLAHEDTAGLKLGYACYYGSRSWDKIPGAISGSDNYLTFNAARPGMFAVLAAKTQFRLDNIPVSQGDRKIIEKFMSAYDLGNMFTGIDGSFNLLTDVSVQEVVLIYEKIVGLEDRNAGMDIRQKARKLGLDEIVASSSVMKNITRQELSYVLIRLYSARTSADIDRLRPSKVIAIKDEDKISDRFYKYVALSVDMGVLDLDGTGSFAPGASVSGAEVIAAIGKLLSLTGDLR